MDFPAVERWRRLPLDTDREEYFQALREAVTQYYLAERSTPYQQSGRSSDANRWEQTRRCFVKALHRSGDFMDVGCANGLLLETLIDWASEEGFAIRPHGIDFIPELIDLARERFPHDRDSFEVANAFYWSPHRQYDFVRTNLEYVPQADWSAFIHHQYAAVAPGGRLILCHYRNRDEPRVDPGSVAEHAGYVVAGSTEIPGTAIAWIQRME